MRILCTVVSEDRHQDQVRVAIKVLEILDQPSNDLLETSVEAAIIELRGSGRVTRSVSLVILP